MPPVRNGKQKRVAVAIVPHRRRRIFAPKWLRFHLERPFGFRLKNPHFPLGETGRRAGHRDARAKRRATPSWAMIPPNKPARWWGFPFDESRQPFRAAPKRRCPNGFFPAFRFVSAGFLRHLSAPKHYRFSQTSFSALAAGSGRADLGTDGLRARWFEHKYTPPNRTDTFCRAPKRTPNPGQAKRVTLGKRQAGTHQPGFSGFAPNRTQAGHGQKRGLYCPFAFPLKQRRACRFPAITPDTKQRFHPPPHCRERCVFGTGGNTCFW